MLIMMVDNSTTATDTINVRVCVDRHRQHFIPAIKIKEEAYCIPYSLEVLLDHVNIISQGILLLLPF